MATQASTLKLWDEAEARMEPHDWTFNGAPTRELTHCYHDYPARMIPQIAAKLLDTFGANATRLFDPYCGTGTSLVEGMIKGISVIGTDLNPLARLIAQAKTSLPDMREVERQLCRFERFIAPSGKSSSSTLTEVAGISRLDFWFKPRVIDDLSKLKEFIDKIEDAATNLFFKVAFSETVRESSNTRNEEFKLYRYEAERLDKFNPDPFAIMFAKLKRNKEGLRNFSAAMSKVRRKPSARVCDFDTVHGTPGGLLPAGSIDTVVTSPPYGDSHTTVAYGQYSRLSAAWLGLDEPQSIDNKLMGGRTKKQLPRFPSVALNEALNLIRRTDEERAYEVTTFYSDLQSSIANVARLVNAGGHACYVVGNRKVKGVVLPTDKVIKDFFEQHDFDHVDTLHRMIPNKRMPLRNSPTNVSGIAEHTMTREYIVVMRRRT